MIRDVESHNRREVQKLQNTFYLMCNYMKIAKKEVDDCWRQNDMIKKAKVAAGKASSCRSNPVDVEEERRYWAEQKVRVHRFISLGSYF